MAPTYFPARYWTAHAGGRVRCALCAHRCRIRPGRSGICQVRHNVAGDLSTSVYGRLVSASADPIEKKPLSHYHPGSTSLSVATVGCNLRCRFCQNASISQWRHRPPRPTPGDEVTPEDLVEAAIRRGCRSLSFTYTEPTIGLEFVEDTGRLARERGVGTVFVTNGFMTPETVDVLSGFLDAANVDLKAMRERTYRRVCKARLAPVLQTIEAMVAAGIWVEVTTLVVPGMNDSDEELAEIAAFLAGVGTHVPWHISAFHPTYEMTDRPRTPLGRLRRAHELGLEAGLKYVYVGNVHGDRGESTVCAGCAHRLIHRVGYSLLAVDLDGDRCPRCGEVLHGVGMAEVSACAR
jgi:pyruvate formate lyase activating enzyme